MIGWTLYVIAVIALIVVLYRRVAEWDRNHDELDRRRTRCP